VVGSNEFIETKIGILRATRLVEIQREPLEGEQPALAFMERGPAIHIQGDQILNRIGVEGGA
jgi:hypothetical protein